VAREVARAGEYEICAAAAGLWRRDLPLRAAVRAWRGGTGVLRGKVVADRPAKLRVGRRSMTQNTAKTDKAGDVHPRAAGGGTQIQTCSMTAGERALRAYYVYVHGSDFAGPCRNVATLGSAR